MGLTVSCPKVQYENITSYKMAPRSNIFDDIKQTVNDAGDFVDCAVLGRPVTFMQSIDFDNDCNQKIEIYDTDGRLLFDFDALWLWIGLPLLLLLLACCSCFGRR